MGTMILSEKLLTAHIKEMESKGAEGYNIGWASGEGFIHSKTTKGRLYSEVVPKTKKIRHQWTKHD